MFVNGNLFHTGNGKDNVIGEIVRMNLGGSGYGDVDYYGGIAAFRIWRAALTGEVIRSWSDVAALDGLLDHPEIDHFVGTLNMAGANGEATDQGALDGWLHGDAARRPLVRARRSWILWLWTSVLPWCWSEAMSRQARSPRRCSPRRWPWPPCR